MVLHKLGRRVYCSADRWLAVISDVPQGTGFRDQSMFGSSCQTVETWRWCMQERCEERKKERKRKEISRRFILFFFFLMCRISISGGLGSVGGVVKRDTTTLVAAMSGCQSLFETWRLVTLEALYIQSFKALPRGTNFPMSDLAKNYAIPLL